MKKTELTSVDGTSLICFQWKPSGDTVSNVLLCHGLGEHPARYSTLAEWLTTKGIAVTMVTLRGHGESQGKRGHVGQWSDYIDDLHAGASEIQGDFFLMGHSMGGLIALDYLRMNSKRVTGTVLTAPLLGVALEAPKWKMHLGRVLSSLLPSLPMANELDPNDICSDPVVVEKYIADPLVHGKITPRWFTEMESALLRVNAHAPRFQTPLLLMWGSEEKMVSTQSLSELLSNWGGTSSGRCWQGLRHEVLNEPNQEELFEEVLTFIQNNDT